MIISLDEGAYMPTRAHPQDAGLDLYATEPVTIPPIDDRSRENSWTFDTGVHIQFDPGYYGKIESKSGLNVNAGIVSLGGVIDEGYTGSIRVKLYNMSHTPYTIHHGDKIAQLVIMPYAAPEMELGILAQTARGAAGFGSTGR